MSNKKTEKDGSSWGSIDASPLGYTKPSTGIFGALVRENRNRSPFVRVVSILISLCLILFSTTVYIWTIYSGYEEIVVSHESVIADYILPVIAGAVVVWFFVALGIKGLKVNLRKK
jgi:hypothetical protein